VSGAAEISDWSIGRVAEAVSSGAVSSEEATRAYLDRIQRYDPRLGAFLYADPERALDQARAVDQKRARREPLGRLAGVPIAVKDNLCTLGMPTTCGSKFLEGYMPPYDAHVVQRLRAEDAVILGKTNMDEFAMGSSNENSAFMPARNPWDLERAPGGSSGGSAVAVAAGLAAGALGSDTGGSVRQPAAFCGVTALKPTYGRVSRYGLVAFASSLDQVGPFGRTVSDTALLMDVVAGHDPRDATSNVAPAEETAAGLGRDLGGLRIGVARDSMLAGVSADVIDRVERAVTALRDCGCQVIDVALPHARHGVSIYYLIATAEASSNLARFDGMRYGHRAVTDGLAETYSESRSYGFGPEVQRRIMLGTYALSAGYYDAYYVRAQRARTRISEDYAAAFERCDVVLTPTAPTTAFRLGEKVDDPLAMYMADVCTLPPSLAGLPALSTPAGLGDDGLPIGVQLTAPAFMEARLIAAASGIETALPKHAPTAYAEGT